MHRTAFVYALTIGLVLTLVPPCPAQAPKTDATKAPPAAPEVWVSPIVSNAADDPRPAASQTLAIMGTRNGCFSGRVAVQSGSAIKGLKATCSALAADGATIPAANVRLRYAVRWDPSWDVRSNRLDVLLEAPPAEVPAPSKSAALAAVWITVDVPRDAKAAVYKGTLTVQADGLPAKTVPVELTVADWTLPDPQDYTTIIEMVQSPDALAMEYNVPLWSERHWKLIAESFDRVQGLGCRNVYVPLLARTNFGNEESMVRWIKKTDGQYEYDFSIMDKYLDLARDHLGTLKMVTFQAWEVYLADKNDSSISFRNREAAKEGREELKGQGPRVTVLDRATGKTEMVYLPRFSDPASKALWQPLFDELRNRLKARGLEKTMYLGVVSDVLPSKEDVTFLKEVSGDLPWVSHAHPGRLRGRPPVGNQALHKIADIAYEAHVYNLNFQVNPEKGRQYGWRQPQMEVRFARNGWPNYSSDCDLHLLPEFNITGGQRGLGRIGIDVWYVTKDNRGRRAGAPYHRYPEVGWRNLDIESWMLAPAADGPVSTARLENLREGVQECEARIAIERALVDPALKAQLGDDLATRCQKLLDDRQHAMWKSIWSDEEDLKSMGAISEREPIEAVWGFLAKNTKKLPGYWDAAARKLRADEARKGQAWFAASPWQDRNRQLFTLAGEVTRKLATAPAK